MRTPYFIRLLAIVFIGFSTLGGKAQIASYQPPTLSNPGSWSLVLLPDPQSYVKFERNQGILELMTGWVSEQIEPLNIGMVLCTGDLVEHNDWLNPNGTQANQPGKKQWEAVAGAFSRLDGKVPYIAATGNHDYGVKSIEYRRTNYNHYFPVDKNPLSQRLLRDVGIDNDGYPSLTNATYEFMSPHGRKFLFMVLEFAPRDTVLRWALEIVNQEKYADYTVVLLTHSFLNAGGEHIVKEGYPITDGNYGAAVWEKLVKPSKNIQLVFSGHIGKPDDILGHIGFRTDTNAAGKRVQQMVFNAQALGGGWHGNGGDGWLRYLEFLPDGKTVNVRTFSPLFAISPSTRQHAWRTAEYDQFTFELD
ncbi:metallophosphoesterase [Parapedobacter defluvii]|uniref:metallophosphoesterase n=1 Tax=Parapedobacter defluvii TaxID=2045106 RepID=UPI000FA1083B|nr:MAG: serine/threonine protein phosphatase [Parapedobacter sp.]